LIGSELTQMGIVFNVVLNGFNVENALNLHFEAALRDYFKVSREKKKIYNFINKQLFFFLVLQKMNIILKCKMQ
jgi:hypothetical protein